MATADRQRTHLSLDRRARILLMANTRRRELAGRSGRFSVPSSDHYPFQWFWDSCFHAIVWSRWDWRRAADELDALFAWQRPDGFIPHVVFWDQRRISLWKWWHYMESVGTPRHKPRTTEQMQPPVLALAVERVVEAGGGAGYLRRVLPKLVAYHEHLAAERDPDRDGLISVLSQFETGLDFSPVWHGGGRRALKGPLVFARLRRPQVPARLHRYDLDRVFRGDLHQESVIVNAIYGRALRALARLARLVDETEVAARADERAARVAEALVAKCLDPRDGLFHDLVGRDERRTSVKTISALAPLILEDLPPEHADRLVEVLTDPRRFWPAYPVPSVALDEPTFSRDSRLWGIRLIWRGPLSMNTNWLLAHGLAEHGYEEQARTIGDRSRELVARHGFNEFYDPLDGSPVGEPSFGWATLAADMP
jgi:hypothetical protein